jgi:hypothetical protein
MQRIFISHASADTAVARTLSEDLRNCGHDVTVDLLDLKLGASLIDFMNTALSGSEIVLILHSKASKQAKWQNIEMDAAIWREVEQGGCRVIVLKLDDSDLPPLLGMKFYGSLTESAYDETLSRLTSELLSRETATTIFNRALAVGSPNPFWRVRAEYFEDELPKLLAEAFSQPEAAKIGLLEEMKPCFLEGSRGTGKTMLLMSLRARILASRRNTNKSIDQLFGFYIRLDRGAFCNAGITAANDGRFDLIDPKLLIQLAETFSQEFYLVLIESLFSEIDFFVKSGEFNLSRAEETAFLDAVFTRIHGPGQSAPQSIESFLDHCADLHRKLADFVRRRFIYDEVGTVVPIATLDTNAFRKIVAITKGFFPRLAKSQLTILLDEYENLFSYQQIVVNSLIKLGPPAFSVKVARKLGTQQSSRTTIGQDLQEIHDYNQVPLIYPVENPNEFKKYYDLLDSIVANLLKSQGYQAMRLTEILQVEDSMEVDPDKLRNEVLSLLDMNEHEFASLTEQEQKEKFTYYREAALFRLVYGKKGMRAEKRYCGAQQLAFISSGVIRWFQEILGMAYHLEYGLKKPPECLIISPESQTQSVHIVSNHNLAALSRNVEEHGERLKYLLLDLGDCLRHKLLRHRSEPEAGRISITNPEQLETDKFRETAELLRVGLREGVFQTLSGRPGMRPKHGEPQPVEFNISRIYAPALQFSPRFRWKTTVLCSELRGLIDPDSRQITKSKLMRKIAKMKGDDGQAEIQYGEAT